MAVIVVQNLSVGIAESISPTPASSTPQPSSLIFVNTNDTSATVTAAGYLNPAKSLYGNLFIHGQLAIVYTTDHGQSAYQVSVSGDDTSLVPEIDPGSVTLPVVSGNFANFDGTDGTLKDSGYSASNAAKTKVVMASAATTPNLIPKFTDSAGTIGNGYTPSDVSKTTTVMANAVTTPNLIPKFTDIAGTIGDGYTPSDTSKTTTVMASAATTVDLIPKFTDIAGTIGNGYTPSDVSKTTTVMAAAAVIPNHIACFSDTEGTVNDDAATAINAGNIQAGLDETAGALVSYPAATTTGAMIVQATSNSGAFNTVITNNALGQTTTFRLPDPNVASAGILVSPITDPDNNANLVRFDVTVGAAALAAGGTVILFASSGAKQYKIINLWENQGGTNFSGGLGRNLKIADGTTTYTIISFVNLETLVNAAWGSTVLPFNFGPVPLTASTAPGASLTAEYSGGFSDFTTGSVVISGLLQRVA